MDNRLRETDALVANLNLAIEAGRAHPSGRAITVATAKGTSAVLDEEDQWATAVRWHEHRSGKNVYLCHAYAADLHVALHSHILPPFPRNGANRIDVDHVDGDSLNNRRFNLRYLSHSENVARGLRHR